MAATKRPCPVTAIHRTGPWISPYTGGTETVGNISNAAYPAAAAVVPKKRRLGNASLKAARWQLARLDAPGITG